MHSQSQGERRDPWLKFFPSNWRADPKLRACSLAARGLWMEMIGLMHEAIPYGYLLLNDKPPSVSDLAMQVGRPVKEVAPALRELAVGGVYSVTSDGVIYSRRMVRTAQRVAVNRANGREGGNPALKYKPPDNQTRESRLTENAEVGKPNDRAPSDNTQIPEDRSQIPQPPSGLLKTELPEDAIASEFLERYTEVYAACRRGARYSTTARTYERDMGFAREVARLWPNVDRLLAMLEVFLRRTDVGPKNVPGTPGQFAHLAPDCDRLLREHGR